MKIFNWVHWRIPTNIEYSRVPHHKKDPYVGGGGSEDHGEKKVKTEKDALLMDLHHVTSIQQVLDGILTIGTLGHVEYSCHKVFVEFAPHAHQQLQSMPSASSEEPAEAEEEKQEEQVKVAASAQPNHNLAIESFKKEMLGILDIKNGSTENTTEEEGDLLEPLLKAVKDNRRERITLADLFLASEDDPANKADPTTLQVAPASVCKVAPEKDTNGGATEMKAKKAALPCHAKHSGSSLAKKLAPRRKGGEDSPPATKKLHGMIRKMLKKKIHPEMARDMNASVPSVQACRRSNSTEDSASLI